MFSHAITTCPSCMVRSVSNTTCRSELDCSSNTRSTASSDSFWISAIMLLHPKISSVFSRMKWRSATDCLSLSSAALDWRLIRSRCAASSVSWRDSKSEISGNSSAASSTDSRKAWYFIFFCKSCVIRLRCAFCRCSCSLSRTISCSFRDLCLISSFSFFSARPRFESFSCRNLLNLMSDSCSSRSCFFSISSRRLNVASRRWNSSFCASSASCTSNICRRFSSSRVAGDTWSNVSCCGRWRVRLAASMGRRWEVTASQ
mmetsp:Transcript_6091/g.13480  ORF Transcript_6091/g.13480 Transcript_6091/m.13480 type:complete len:259 (-) Transcript_6091:164-940(-)